MTDGVTTQELCRTDCNKPVPLSCLIFLEIRMLTPQDTPNSDSQEASRIAADLACNADKDAGGPARRNQERAFALQMAQPQTNEGFFV